MLPELARGVAALRRRRFVLGWLELAGVHVQVALFVLGAVVLYLRVFERWERGPAAALFAWGGLALVSAAVLARRRVPSGAYAAAWLDVQGGALGAVVTESELGGSAWSARAKEQLAAALASLPRPELGRALKPTLVPALFAGLALWVPIPKEVVGPPPVVATALIEDLEAKLATLEETLELPAEEAEELAARLERIQAEAENGQPASTFEAIDRLAQRLEDEAARALEAAQRAGEDLARAAGDPSLASAQEALETALAGMKDAGLAKELPPEARAGLMPGTLSLPPGAQLDSRELAKLSQELKGALEAKLGKLGNGKLLDASKLRLLEGGLPGLGEGFGELDPEHECDEDCKKPGGT